MADSRFAFDALLKKTNPSSERVDVAKNLHGDVRDWLTAHEYETCSPHSRLIGSYARHTAICEIKDVDVVVFLPESALDRTPESVLRELKKVLKEYPGSTVETSPQRRSIRMDFPDEECTIDIVPAVAEDGIEQPLRIPDRGQEEWILSDPLGYGETLSAANSHHGKKLVPDIKLSKAWRDQQMQRRKTKSYLLEVIFYRVVTSGAVTLVGESTAQNLCDFFEHIEGKWRSLMDQGSGMPRVLDPQLGTVLKWERPNFETFMRRIRDGAKAARRAIDAKSDDDAAEEWKKVFGDLWPTPDEVEQEARCAAKDGQPGRAFVSAAGGCRSVGLRWWISESCDDVRWPVGIEGSEDPEARGARTTPDGRSVTCVLPFRTSSIASGVTARSHGAEHSSPVRRRLYTPFVSSTKNVGTQRSGS